jgi:5-methylcytosine-specific restriction endonuclease McrA
LRCDCGREIKRTTQSLCNWARLAPDKRMRAHCGCKNKHGAESIALEIFESEYSDGDISFEKFIELSQQSCFHCGCTVDETGRTKTRRSSKRSNGKRSIKDSQVISEFKYHGLDRIDNNKGHTLDNVVPCCWECNKLRGSRDLSSFLQHITKIVENNKKKTHSNNVSQKER